MSDIITRFAPSPTGRLHIGHAYSALYAFNLARTRTGKFLLRIEDIDGGRCRPEFIGGIYEDLAWLGLAWEEPVWRQSERMDVYQKALKTLEVRGVLYPCFCTRKEIEAEIAGAVSAPHGPEGALYPGTCRNLSRSERQERIAAGEAYALRLNMAEAIAQAGPLTWYEEGEGEHKGAQTATPEVMGDVVLARKDVPASYHLCVVIDDAAQGVTHVTRGEDLFYATHLHRLLQALLDVPVPVWSHHKLLLDENGKRFAKRNESVTLEHLRCHRELTPQSVIKSFDSYCR